MIFDYELWCTFVITTCFHLKICTLSCLMWISCLCFASLCLVIYMNNITLILLACLIREQSIQVFSFVYFSYIYFILSLIIYSRQHLKWLSSKMESYQLWPWKFASVSIQKLNFRLLKIFVFYLNSCGFLLV